jgi:hypothetical protein
MASGGHSRTTIEEMQQPMKKPYAKHWDEKTRGVVFPGHHKVKAEIGNHPAMVHENQTHGGFLCKNGTGKNPQTHWWRKGRSAPPTRWVPHSPRTAPASSDDIECSKTEGVPPGYVYIHTPLPSTWLVKCDPSTNDCMRIKDFIPDLRSDGSPSTGYFTISCVVMQLTAYLKTTAAVWVNLTATTRVDWTEWDLWVLSLSAISGHFTVYFAGYIYMHHERTM